MKLPFHLITMLAIPGIISISCNNQNQAVKEPDKIENTLQSVSYFKDTIGYDTQQLLDLFNQYNKAIAEIGYPDAGYQLWLIQTDTSDVKFMVQGHWPDQNIYNEIHEHELYQEVANSNEGSFDGIIWIEYHRFTKIK